MLSRISLLQMAAADNWDETRTAATKPKAAPKVRKPEEVWYDVHKHPEGVPGGMGKSPEHHLRRRGWSPHEINEGSGKKTIQYRNHEFPDFVVSYGGGTGTKPDHNFRVLYMGTNRNVPKVTRSYSVAEAMNKVEELHQLQSGLVVQPLTYGAAAPFTEKPSIAGQDLVTRYKTFVAPVPNKTRRDMSVDDFHPIGKIDREFPTKPDEESDWDKSQLKEIPDPPEPNKKKAYLLRLAGQSSWENSINKAALGDLRYEPGHPQAGQLMSDKDAHEYLMSYRTTKPRPDGISDGEHVQVMGAVPQMDASGPLEYSFWDPEFGRGSNHRIWMKADPDTGDRWHVGWDDEYGDNRGSFHPTSVPLDEALDTAHKTAKSWGWLHGADSDQEQ